MGLLLQLQGLLGLRWVIGKVVEWMEMVVGVVGRGFSIFGFRDVRMCVGRGFVQCKW